MTMTIDICHNYCEYKTDLSASISTAFKILTHRNIVINILYSSDYAVVTLIADNRVYVMHTSSTTHSIKKKDNS